MTTLLWAETILLSAMAVIGTIAILFRYGNAWVYFQAFAIASMMYRMFNDTTSPKTIIAVSCILMYYVFNEYPIMKYLDCVFTFKHKDKQAIGDNGRIDMYECQHCGRIKLVDNIKNPEYSKKVKEQK